MKIGLIGYGKMGKEIESLLPWKEASITQKFNRTNLLETEKLKGIDVAIDFSSPSTVIKNIEICVHTGIPMVIGTTGWNSEIEKIKNLVLTKNTGLIYASNFSIGVNLFFKIIKEASKLIDVYDHYDVSIHEIHHRKKLDSPSGTALTIGEKILSAMSKKKTINARTEGIKPDELQIASTRVGSVPGTHTVIFDSPEDTIELTHTARNRRGFALGALLAAEWIRNKKGFFTIEDML